MNYTLSGSGKSAAELGVAAMRVAAEAGVTYSLTGDAPLRGVASSNVDTWARLADVLDDIADQGFRWPHLTFALDEADAPVVFWSREVTPRRGRPSLVSMLAVSGTLDLVGRVRSWPREHLAVAAV